MVEQQSSLPCYAGSPGPLDGDTGGYVGGQVVTYVGNMKIAQGGARDTVQFTVGWRDLKKKLHFPCCAKLFVAWPFNMLTVTLKAKNEEIIFFVLLFFRSKTVLLMFEEKKKHF